MSTPAPGGSVFQTLLRAGIVPQCVKLIRRDIFDNGQICLLALEAIESLARTVMTREQEQSNFRKQTLDAGFWRTCIWVRVVKSVRNSAKCFGTK